MSDFFRLQKHIDELSAIGARDGAITRLGLSAEEQAARDLGDRRRCRKGATGAESEVYEELACLVQSIAAKPPKQLLGAVRRHHETDHDSREEKSDAQRRQIHSVCVHSAFPAIIK